MVRARNLDRVLPCFSFRAEGSRLANSLHIISKRWVSTEQTITQCEILMLNQPMLR